MISAATLGAILAATLAPDQPKWTDVWTTRWTAVGAIATFSAVVVALCIVWIDRWLGGRAEAEAEQRSFKAAALLVWDELRANIVRFEIALGPARQASGSSDSPPPMEVPDELAGQTYQDHQLLLAQHLDRETLDAIRAAYVFVRVPRAMVTRYGPFEAAEGPIDEPLESQVRTAFERARRAYELLERYIPEGTARI